MFGALLESGSRTGVAGGYLLGAGLMIAAGIFEWVLGVPAEGRPLELIAPPLTSADEGLSSAGQMPVDG